MADVFMPKSLEELLPLIDNESMRITAGCTDIMVALRVGKLKYKPMIDINGLMDIKSIFEKQDEIFIGSNVVMTDIINNRIIKDNFPILIKAIETIGSQQIRNRATLGGNIQNASPSGDSILALTLLEAELVLLSRRGERRIGIKEFIKGVGKTDLNKDEFIEYIVLNKRYKSYENYFEKVGLRNAMVISIASMGAIYSIKNNVIEDIKIAYGAVAPRVLEVTEAENFLKGKTITKENLLLAGEIIYKVVSPIDDVRSTAQYRREVSKNLILRLLG